MQLRHCWRSAAQATVRRFRRTSKSGTGSIAAAYGSGGLSVKERLWQRDGFAALAFALVFALLAYGVFADSFQRSEAHTSELQSLMRISYAVFCLKKKTTSSTTNNQN